MLSSSANATVLGWQEQGQCFRVSDRLINTGKMNVEFLLEEGQCFNCCSFIHLNKNKTIKSEGEPKKCNPLEISYSAVRNYFSILAEL